MQIRLLGPVQVCANGRELDVGPRQQRHVLAVLAADAGRSVTPESLMDRVWEQVPPGARRALHVHITRIRRLLERTEAAAAPPTSVVRSSGGYLLDIDTDLIDIHRLRRLVERARASHRADERAGLLREAVGLWRGDPLDGLTGSWPARTRERWRREYFDTVVAWTRAELDIGNPGAAIATLRDLTGEYPLMESLAVALMRALHAAGDPAEALKHHATVRQHLADELGADPSAELQAVYQAILRGELDPPPAPATTRPMAAEPVVPMQLPADVSGFTGRAEHLADLAALVASRPERASTAVVISAVSGAAGVGKTALAVHWAHTVAEKFPDGQLYVNLRGFDPTGRVMAPIEAVRGFLHALGVPPERIPPDLDAQTALYRSLLAGKRILVVLDNARDAEQARPLLPGTPTAMAVVTSRTQLTGLLAADGAHPLHLDLLSTTEARDLLTHRLGDRVTAEPDAVQQIITACARLPLALSIAAARAQQTNFPLATLAAELNQADQQLDALDAGDPTSQLRAVFSWSYTALTAPSARLFRLLGLHRGPDIATPAAASLAGHPVSETRRLLNELTRANLLVEHVPGRYTFHDLLRAYATELTHTTDSDQTHRAALTRLLDHYTHTAHTADRLLYPTRDPIPVALAAAAADVSPERLTDHQQAIVWLTAEHPTLLATIRHAADTGFDTHTWQLAWALNMVLYQQGHWADQAAAWQAAVDAARRLNDPAAQAAAHRGVARGTTQLGRHADAHTHLQHALDLYTQIGDQVGQGYTHYNLGYLWQRQGRFDLALGHGQQALTVHRAAGHRPGQAHALNSVGWCHAQLGDYTDALTACQQALTLFQQLGDRSGQASTWDSLGYVHHHLGHHSQAIDCYQHALALLRNLGERYHEANVLTHLGDTHHTSGNPNAAGAAWTDALTILTGLGDPGAPSLRAKLHALDQQSASPTESG
ncbi:BTAD domain-containing putative transcriptional regulator [Asanoa sp. NPDC049573]|uniref:AfsR/SARP family transcriptional regulator n=1 Tax=Asanoa sp. NPDC049573 TaxID=3155396 RepID=UPI00343F2BEC